MPRTVSPIASGRTEAQEGGQDVVSVFLVGREQPIFDEKRLVGPIILGNVRSMENVTVVRNPGRPPEYDFSILKRDQLQPLAGAKVVGRDPVGIPLPQLIV